MHARTCQYIFIDMYVQQRAGETDKEGLSREARERIINAKD